MDNSKENINREIENEESGGKKVVNWFKKNIVNLFLFGLSIYFVFNGAIKFTPNEMDWWEKIVYIFTTMVFGLIITSLVGESGYTAGKCSEDYIRARENANECGRRALPHKKEAELFVSKKIDNDIKEERIEILAKAGIDYSEIFNIKDVPYVYKNLKKNYTHKQRRAIKRAIKIKKVPFLLFGVSLVKNIGRKEAPSENKRRLGKFTTGFITKAILALASGSVAVSFIGISVSSLIYSLFQLALWFGSGLIARVSNYNFIVNDVRAYHDERTWYIEEFLALDAEQLKALSEEVSLKESQEVEIKRIGMHIPVDTETPKE